MSTQGESRVSGRVTGRIAAPRKDPTDLPLDLVARSIDRGAPVPRWYLALWL